MSDTKWTPGPWQNGCDIKGRRLVFADEPSEFHNPDTEALANRRLLDAAPDLYEALGRFVNNSSAQTNMPDECEQAERAMAKARGES